MFVYIRCGIGSVVGRNIRHSTVDQEVLHMHRDRISDPVLVFYKLSLIPSIVSSDRRLCPYQTKKGRKRRVLSFVVSGISVKNYSEQQQQPRAIIKLPPPPRSYYLIHR